MLGSIGLLALCGVWWHNDVRLKLFQGVLVNYKIAGRDNYVNKIDTNPAVAALYSIESWWAACLDYKGRSKGCKAN